MTQKVYRWPFLSSLRDCRYILSAEKTFLNSSTFTLINPQRTTVATNTVSHGVVASYFNRVTDEELLARFTKGFFGGRVMAVERFMLGLGLWRWFPVHFTDFSGNSTKQNIWSSSELSCFNTPAIGSVLFGIFIVLDRKNPETDEKRNTSYIDYGYGSDKYKFAGCHRFQITRPVSRQLDFVDPISAKEEPKINFSVQGFVCNPQANRLTTSNLMAWFHSMYVRLLFADGMREVLRH